MLILKIKKTLRKKKKIIVISLSASLVFITLIAGLFLVKKNKESGFENNDIGEVVNENNDNEKEADKDKPKKIKNKDEKKSEEKNNADQKDENEDNQKETDDLPWQLNWIGAVIDLIISIIIVAIFKKIILTRYPNINKDCCSCTRILFLLLRTFIFSFFYFVVFPLIFAIKKYKNKSYRERFKLAEKSFLSIISKIKEIYKIVIAIFVILFVIFIVISARCIPNPPKTNSQLQTENNKNDN